MSVEIKIPPVGESITSGLIAEWHKKNGEAVAEGDLLLTLETDKVSTEITAEVAGVLEVLVEEDVEVAIGAVVGSIHDGGVAATGAAPVTAEDKNEAEAEKLEDAPAGGADGGAEESAGEEPPDLTVVPAAREQAPSLPVARGDGASDAGRTVRKKMSPLRRKIAAQLVHAQQTAAILTTFNECDMSAVMALRKEVQESFVARHGVKLGFMSFFIKAVVEALKEVPKINSRLDGEEVVLNQFFDIGVAVGTEKGLVVPVVRDADRKPFAGLEKDIVDFATRAREGKIQITDLQGGVFTISNGGVYGSLLSTPILNPPQSGILGMHTIQQRPVAVGGEVEVRPMMYLALSYDHRIVDGGEAVTFLIRVKECIENPARLMLGV